MNSRVLFSLIVVTALAAPSYSEASCSSIRLLKGGMDRVELDLLNIFDLVDPGPNQQKVVADAMGYFAPLHCHAVTRIAFQDLDGSEGQTMAWVGSAKPDLLNIVATSSKASETNLSLRSQAPAYRAGAVSSIIHEASHAAHHLLKFVAPRAEWKLGEKALMRQDWSPDALAYAEDLVKKNLLDRGLLPEWQDLHQRAVDLGENNDYHGRGDPKMTPDQIIKMGVASPYGGDGADEDIAEMSSGIMAVRAWSNYGATIPTPAEDLICERMRAAEGPGVPKELALIYAKVGFLHSVGLIGDLEYDNCVGDLKVRAPGNGFFSLKNGQQVNAYISNVEGRIGKREDDGMWVFQMEAKGQFRIEGKTKPGRIELIIPLAPAGEPRPSFPRGLYGIGGGGEARTTVYYTDEGQEKVGVSVENGLVLVSRASTELVEGSIFVFRLVNWTELFPLPIPPKEDTIFTFRKKN